MREEQLQLIIWYVDRILEISGLPCDIRLAMLSILVEKLEEKPNIIINYIYIPNDRNFLKTVCVSINRGGRNLFRKKCKGETHNGKNNSTGKGNGILIRVCHSLWRSLGSGC